MAAGSRRRGRWHLPAEGFLIWIEWTLAALYLLAGPGAWVLFAFAAVKGRRRLALVTNPLAPLPEPPPRVSLLIPCKDEQERIGPCLRSALEQDYPDLQVIAIDDRSTDATPQIMRDVAATHPRLLVLQVPHAPLPPGWTGKNNALATGTRSAEGDWLVFVDSDVTLRPAAVRAAVSIGEHKQFDLVSFVPHFETQTFWEELIIPLCGMATSGMYQITYANSAMRPGTAFACGQFIALRRSVYDAIGGHEALVGKFADDVELARLLKRTGRRPRLAWGAELVRVRMYSSFKQIFRGWARNFFAGDAGKPWKIIAAMLVTLLCGLSFIPAFAWGLYRNAYPVTPLAGWGWMATAGAHVAFLLGCLAISYRWSGNRVRMIFLFPLGAVLMLAILCRSLWMCWTGKVSWRGTSYVVKPGQVGAQA